MIFNLITNFVLLLIGLIFYFFPVVSIASLPVVGPSLSAFLVTGMGWWYTILSLIPPLHDTWLVLLWVILPFEIGLILLKVFFGHRAPINS